jgi:hypothetical protein
MRFIIRKFAIIFILLFTACLNLMATLSCIMKQIVLLFGIALSVIISTTCPLQSSGQVGQGLVRCTAGNLVKSPSECPSTDLCAPPNNSSIVHCTSRELPPASSVSQVIYGNESEAVNITTERKVYNLGDIVKMTVNNSGTQPLTFSNSTIQVVVKSLDTNQSYPVSSSGPVRFTLDTDASRNFTWDQKDVEGQQAKPGNYSASVSVGSLNANATFSTS